MAATLVGKYHPDPEIDAGIAADAEAAEQANLAAGFDPTPWECTCGAAHNGAEKKGWQCTNCERWTFGAQADRLRCQFCSAARPDCVDGAEEGQR